MPVVDAGVPDAGQPDAGSPDPVDAGTPACSGAYCLVVDGVAAGPLSFTLQRSSVLTIDGFFTGFFIAGLLPLGTYCLESFWINPGSQANTYALRLPQNGVCQGPCSVTLATLFVSFASTEPHGQATGYILCGSTTQDWNVSF
jgi:hypothetical protein